MNLNELRDKAYNTACEHGFHDKKLSNEHCLMLVITELSEAVKADRKGLYMTEEDKKEYLFCQKEKFYMYAYDNYIKGSVDEEIADACIRLLDLAGLRNIDFGDWDNGWEDIVNDILPDAVTKYTFTEEMFAACRNITDQLDSIEDVVCSSIGVLRVICYVHNIDLELHIEQKMIYNSLREKMHGKKY